MPAQETTAFVLCIEENEVRDQALRLVESLRRWGGRHANAEVIAVSPRAGLGAGTETCARLAELGVRYHEEPLNSLVPEHASANRVYAGAWAAGACDADTLFVLDSDGLFLGEPQPLGDWDLAVRPVDVKGRTSAGPDDPMDPYWVALCALAGVAVDVLPMVETTLDRTPVRASYNGGYVVVRRASGILERTAELFSAAIRASLEPRPVVPGERVFASTGWVAPDSARWWGSTQAALAVAAWSTTRRVRLLDRRHNVPLHGLAERGPLQQDWRGIEPLHVHLHWMLDPGHRAAGLRLLGELGATPEQLEWIAARTPYRQPIVAVNDPQRKPAAAPRRDNLRSPLVVCGMHRSGTSLVANALQRAGLDIGAELNPGGHGNPRGHFEDVTFHRLHEELLASAGGTAFSFDDDALTAVASGADPRARAVAAARAARAGERPWGWKDPRTALFLDLWTRVLPEPRFIVLYRHPVDVALSLWRRDTNAELSADPWLAIRAWERYNSRLLSLRERHPSRCLVAHVATVTADLPAFVRRVAAAFDLPLAPEAAADVYATGELTAAAGLRQPWETLLAPAFAIYRRLEAVADLPSRAARLASVTMTSSEHGVSALEERLAYRVLAVGEQLAQTNDVVARIVTSRSFRPVRWWWDLQQRWRAPSASPPEEPTAPALASLRTERSEPA